MMDNLQRIQPPVFPVEKVVIPETIIIQTE